MKKLNVTQMENLQGGKSLVCDVLQVMFQSSWTPIAVLEFFQCYYIHNCQGGGY